ncbi:hypothetical protein CAEBREN_00594 [Caenorhabditis brenneri]|uniref:Uncharacterized protein n=1 Tax=Caenorhabditis brenneri TaxID=135651 RepID=G0MAE7_CAEBE|nr:hypothetical protein CAEBREN_00594 [Caenorhabditis brenneri]
MEKRNDNNQGGGRKATEKGKGPHQKKNGAKNAPVIQNEQHAKNSNGENGGNSGNGGNGGNSGIGKKKGGSFGVGGHRGSSGSGEKQGKPGNGVNSGFDAEDGKTGNGVSRGNSGVGGNRAQSGIGENRGGSGTGRNAGAAFDSRTVDNYHSQNVGGPEESNRQGSDSFNSPRPTPPCHKGVGNQKPLMNVSKHSEKSGNGAGPNHQEETSNSYGNGNQEPLMNVAKHSEKAGNGGGNFHQERTSNSYGQHAIKRNSGGSHGNDGNGGDNRDGFGGQQPLMKSSGNYHQECSLNSYGGQNPLKNSANPGNGANSFHQEGSSNSYGQHANKRNSGGVHGNAGNGGGNRGGYGGQRPLMKMSGNYHQEGSSNSYGGQNPLKNSAYPGNGANSFHQEGSSNSYGQHTNKRNSGGSHGNGGNGKGSRGGFGGQQPLMKNSGNYHQEGSSNSYGGQKPLRNTANPGNEADNYDQEGSSNSNRNEEALSGDALRRVTENLPQIQQTIRRHETAQASALREERFINSDAYGFGHQEIGFYYETIPQEDTSTATNLVISVNQEGVRQVREVRGDQQYEDQSRRTSSDSDGHGGPREDRSHQNDDSRHPERSANQDFDRRGGHGSSGVREAQGERSSRDRDSRHHTMNSRNSVDTNRQAQGNISCFRVEDSRGSDNHSNRHLKTEDTDDYPPFDYHNSVAPNRGRYRSIYSSSSNGSRSPTHRNRQVQGSSSSHAKNTLDDYPPYDPHNSVAPSTRRNLLPFYSPVRRNHEGSSSSQARNDVDDYPLNPPTSSVSDKACIEFSCLFSQLFR